MDEHLVTDVHMKFNYDWLHIHRLLQNFWNSDNNNENNVCGAWTLFLGPITLYGDALQYLP